MLLHSQYKACLRFEKLDVTQIMTTNIILEFRQLQCGDIGHYLYYHDMDQDKTATVVPT